jgi:hypothetical protein
LFVSECTAELAEAKPATAPHPKWGLQRRARVELPEYRNLRKCYSCPRCLAVEVHRSDQRSSAAYRGLTTCQSVWSCPVCSSKIAAHRAGEITHAIAQWRSEGGTALLLTFTARHTRDDRLADLVRAHLDAHRRFWAQRAVKQTLRSIGSIGRVMSFEITYGPQTGWHPHRHVLLFVRADADPANLQSVLAPEWSRAAARAGLDAHPVYGLDVRGGHAAGEYVAKLGLEVALSVRKLGRNGRYGVWEVLAITDADRGPAWARGVFRTYATTMRGKTHLKWSRGLKARLGVAEMTDEQVMEAPAEADETLYLTLTKQAFAVVNGNDARGELLKLCGLDDRDEVAALLTALGVFPEQYDLKGGA